MSVEARTIADSLPTMSAALFSVLLPLTWVSLAADPSRIVESVNAFDHDIGQVGRVDPKFNEGSERFKAKSLISRNSPVLGCGPLRAKRYI